jgi:hypothetical protein
MSVTNSQAAVRRSPAAAPAAPVRAQRVALPEHSDLDQSLKLNLSDIPMPARQELDVEGFKPSLLSRILDIFVRR